MSTTKPGALSGSPVLWIPYGKDKLSTDGRWHLQHNHIQRIGTWWVVYEKTPEGTAYRGQATSLKGAKDWVQQLLKEKES